MNRLQGQVAIVTGGAQGIGKAIAETFAQQERATVVLADRNPERGAAAAAEIKATENSLLFIECDVSSEQQVNAMVAKTLDTFGRIDILVNNAGVNFVKPFDKLTSQDWDHVMNVDLRGVFLCIRGCIEHFLQQGKGNVINIASVHTVAALPGAAPYDAAKCGVVGMTKSLATEYADRNLRFNCISPGLIDTQIWKDILSSAEDQQECQAHWWANIPAGRVGKPQEIARIAAFLASDESDYINGANILADGGMTSQLISRS